MQLYIDFATGDFGKSTIRGQLNGRLRCKRRNCDIRNGFAIGDFKRMELKRNGVRGEEMRDTGIKHRGIERVI